MPQPGCRNKNRGFYTGNMNAQPRMHQKETYLQPLSQSPSSSSQKPIRGSLSPSHPSRSAPFFPSKYSLLSLRHLNTHTPLPLGGVGGVTAPLMHAHGDEPLVQSHTHTHTNASFHEEEHPAAVFMVALCGGRCSKQQACRSCRGLRVS